MSLEDTGTLRLRERLTASLHLHINKYVSLFEKAQKLAYMATSAYLLHDLAMLQLLA